MQTTTLRDGTEVLAKDDGDAWKGMHHAMAAKKAAALEKAGEGRWEVLHSFRAPRCFFLRPVEKKKHEGA